jgi:glucose-6-phosphate 1-epimerase
MLSPLAIAVGQEQETPRGEFDDLACPRERNFFMHANTMVAELDRRFTVPGIARVSEGNGGLPRVEIAGSLAQGEMYLHGAHVTSWKPAGHEESLFLSTKSLWQEGRAIRGGIPICFPWFRAKVNDPRAPAHGFVRTTMWQLESIREEERGVVVSMYTESNELTRHWWPWEFRLVHRVRFGSELSLELVSTNTGTASLRFEEALHTYNRVADVGHVRLEGLDQVRFLDNTDFNKQRTQRGAVEIAAPTDNAYLDTESEIDLLDPALGRQIRLTKSNSHTTVVWNPWREGAAALKDLGDGEWKQFLCVEASNILASAVELAPGQEHTMTAVLNLGKL